MRPYVHNIHFPFKKMINEVFKVHAHIFFNIMLFEYIYLLLRRTFEKNKNTVAQYNIYIYISTNTVIATTK